MISSCPTVRDTQMIGVSDPIWMLYGIVRARAGGRVGVVWLCLWDSAGVGDCHALTLRATSLPTSSFFLRQPRMHSSLNSYLKRRPAPPPR
jgi:hypothetical protein